MTTYTADGLSIMCGDRVVCTAMARIGFYNFQVAEIKAMVDAMNLAPVLIDGLDGIVEKLNKISGT